VTHDARTDCTRSDFRYIYIYIAYTTYHGTRRTIPRVSTSSSTRYNNSSAVVFFVIKFEVIHVHLHMVASVLSILAIFVFVVFIVFIIIFIIRIFLIFLYVPCMVASPGIPASLPAVPRPSSMLQPPFALSFSSVRSCARHCPLTHWPQANAMAGPRHNKSTTTPTASRHVIRYITVTARHACAQWYARCSPRTATLRQRK
jgi:hypothetical protein